MKQLKIRESISLVLPRNISICVDIKNGIGKAKKIIVTVQDKDRIVQFSKDRNLLLMNWDYGNYMTKVLEPVAKRGKNLAGFLFVQGNLFKIKNAKKIMPGGAGKT